MVCKLPNSGLVALILKKQELVDYGYVNKENWRQYQRSIAADDAGWIYFGLGNASSQILALSVSQNERWLAYFHRMNENWERPQFTGMRMVKYMAAHS